MYCKLFTSLYQGTLRGRSDEILVFTNLLAHCDREGYVDKHWRAISEEVGLPEDRVKAALIILESIDEESRSPDEQGRRIVRVDDHRAWGWRVTNYVKYRTIRNEEDRREANREAQARFREKHKAPNVISVSNSNASKPMQYADADADADAEKDTPNPKADRHSAYRLRLGRMFNRRDTTFWSEKELKAFSKIKPDRDAFEEELALQERFYLLPVESTGPLSWRRRDPLTLINNWPGDLDRANAWFSQSAQDPVLRPQ